MSTKQVCWCNEIESEELSRLEIFLKVMADKNRLRIMCLLNKKGELCVCEIFKSLELTQNLTSHHLKKLSELSLLQERKEGVFVFYSINQNAVKEYKTLFKKIILK